MNRWNRTIAIFLIILLIAMCGCGGGRGRTIRYDGYTIRTEKSAEQEPPAEETAISRGSQFEEAGDYVLNKSSKKFHDPSCTGAAEIKESNRWEYHGTRQSILDMGYSPCKICNP